MNIDDLNSLEIDMIDGLKDYIDYIKADYRKWFKGRDDGIAVRMIE